MSQNNYYYPVSPPIYGNVYTNNDQSPYGNGNYYMVNGMPTPVSAAYTPQPLYVYSSEVMNPTHATESQAQMSPQVVPAQMTPHSQMANMNISSGLPPQMPVAVPLPISAGMPNSPAQPILPVDDGQSQYQVQFVNAPYASPRQRRRFRPAPLPAATYEDPQTSATLFNSKIRRSYMVNNNRPISPPTNMHTPQGGLGVGKPQISVFEMKASRPRRRIGKATADVKYPMNYPAHAVPDYMRFATSLPGGAAVLPPLPETITTRRYATSVDERNFLTVLEYEINGQTIIWDYYTGYVHLTGLWKAVGHTKADIVRLLDYSPELEPLIKRVRGGFLKIQGTWVPYDVARKLACRVCFYIRYALVPLFGSDFPEDCMKPDKPGFGMLQMYYPSNAFTSRTGQMLSKFKDNDEKDTSKPLRDNTSISSTSPIRTESTTNHFTEDGGSIIGNSSSVKNSWVSAPTNARPAAATKNLIADSVSAPILCLPASPPRSLGSFDSSEEDQSPPPLPRKPSFREDNASEILAMLKATCSIKQTRSIKHPDPAPPTTTTTTSRQPTLKTILNA